MSPRSIRIAAIGDLSQASATRVLEAKGLAVAPGFINMRSWSVDSLIVDGKSQGEIRQGVSTEIFGEGDSMGPLTPGPGLSQPRRGLGSLTRGGSQPGERGVAPGGRRRGPGNLDASGPGPPDDRAPLVIDANEITDKGYINQRAVLERRAALVDRLYDGGPDVLHP